MVDERITDGRRIAELLASELHGRADRALASVAVVDAAEDVEPTPDGALAYRLEVDGEPLGAVHVHDERARLTLRRGPEAAVEAAREAGLRVRPAATDPPRALVFVEDGAAVKRTADVVAAAARDG